MIRLLIVLLLSSLLSSCGGEDKKTVQNNSWERELITHMTKIKYEDKLVLAE